MRLIGNIIWFVFHGVWLAIGWVLMGLLLAIPIVTLPFARQCFKIAHFALWPFGRQVVRSPDASPLGPIGAVLWFIPGLILAIGYVITGALMCLTVIGIPFGIQAIKMAGLALAPFGKEIVTRGEVKDALAAARAANAGEAA